MFLHVSVILFTVGTACGGGQPMEEGGGLPLEEGGVCLGEGGGCLEGVLHGGGGMHGGSTPPPLKYAEIR